MQLKYLLVISTALLAAITHVDAACIPQFRQFPLEAIVHVEMCADNGRSCGLGVDPRYWCCPGLRCYADNVCREWTKCLQALFVLEETYLPSISYIKDKGSTASTPSYNNKPWAMPWTKPWSEAGKKAKGKEVSMIFFSCFAPLHILTCKKSSQSHTQNQISFAQIPKFRRRMIGIPTFSTSL